MLATAKLLFRVGQVENLTETRTLFEMTLATMLWRALQSLHAEISYEGYLGVAAVAVLPEEGWDEAHVRAEMEKRLINVLGHFLSHASQDYDTDHGNTKYGPYTLGLVIHSDIDIVRKRIKVDLQRLRKIVKQGNMEESDDNEASRNANKRQISNVAALFQGMPQDYKALAREIENLNHCFRRELATQLQAPFNRELRNRLAEQPLETQAAKKAIASWIKEQLDRFHLAIRHPEEGYPCNLITLPAYDRQGVFLLESREGRKRTHTTTDLSSLLDFTLVDASPGQSQQKHTRTRN